MDFKTIKRKVGEKTADAKEFLAPKYNSAKDFVVPKVKSAGKAIKKGGEKAGSFIKEKVNDAKDFLERKKAKKEIDSELKSLNDYKEEPKKEVDLTTIKGIGTTTAVALKENGFISVADIQNASVKELTAIKGIGTATATKFIQAAKEL